MREFTKQYPVIRYKDGMEESAMDDVLAECSLDVYINGSFRETLHCVPEYLEEMLLGRLYTSGAISSLDDVEDVTFCSSRCRADITLHKSGRRSMDRLPDSYICPEEILSLSDYLLNASDLFKKTGNVHSVMLCRRATVLYVTEDLDRFHAFDKTVGRALKDHVDFTGTSIYTTGRIPCPIAEKAIWARIPVIVSRSAPTDLTLDLAKQYNLTVMGFARTNRMNIYNPPMPDM